VRAGLYEYLGSLGSAETELHLFTADDDFVVVGKLGDAGKVGKEPFVYLLLIDAGRQ
jgi:hypothetical protein